MTPDIVLTPEQQKAIRKYLRHQAKMAAAAVGKFHQWAAEIDIEADRLRLGIKAEDGRQVSGFGLRAVLRAASRKSSWGNPFLGIVAEELLRNLDPKLAEQAEARRRKNEAEARERDQRLVVWWGFRKYMEEEGAEAAVDLLNEIERDFGHDLKWRHGVRLVLMPENVVPLNRRA